MALNMKLIHLDFPRIEVTQEFIDNNNLSLNRTDAEIIQHMKENINMFSFGDAVLIDYLSYDHAKEYLTNEYNNKVKNGEIEEPKPIIDILEAAQDFLDYMVFAWGKAIDERGISASRSISKLGAWLFLLGRPDLYDIIHDESLYNPYGMRALIKVCEEMRIEVPQDCYDFIK